jgi:hypothetical protein
MDWNPASTIIGVSVAALMALNFFPFPADDEIPVSVVSGTYNKEKV